MTMFSAMISSVMISSVMISSVMISSVLIFSVMISSVMISSVMIPFVMISSVMISSVMISSTMMSSVMISTVTISSVMTSVFSETYGETDVLTSDKDCSACLGGKFCNGRGGPPKDCPKGHYCPAGLTSFDTQFPCPAGTYNPTEG